jgi:hypothetical protein
MNQKDLSSYLTKENYINFGIVSGLVYVANMIIWTVASDYRGYSGTGLGPDLLSLQNFNPLSILNAIYFAFTYETLPYVSSFGLRTITWVMEGNIDSFVFIFLIFFLLGLCINFVIGIKFSDSITKVLNPLVSKIKANQNNVIEDQTMSVEDPTISVKDWVINYLIMIIPIANIVMIIIWGFGGKTQPTKANWAKALLLFLAINIVLVLIFSTIFAGLINSMF